MAAPYDIALPPNIDLWDSCVIRVTAIDPSTGDTVSGVTVSQVNLEVTQLRGGNLEHGTWHLVPGPGA